MKLLKFAVDSSSCLQNAYVKMTSCKCFLAFVRLREFRISSHKKIRPARKWENDGGENSAVMPNNRDEGKKAATDLLKIKVTNLLSTHRISLILLKLSPGHPCYVALRIYVQ